MAKKPIDDSIFLRIPHTVKRALVREAARLSKETGVNYNQSNLVRKYISDGLAAAKESRKP